MLYSGMLLVHCCSCLSRMSSTDIEIKSLDELDKIGEKTHNSFLIWQIFMCRNINHFWRGEYTEMAQMSEKYSIEHPQSQQKRILQVLLCFYEGIAYFALARDTKQAKYRTLGEKALMNISQFKMVMGDWNFGM